MEGRIRILKLHYNVTLRKNPKADHAAYVNMHAQCGQRVCLNIWDGFPQLHPSLILHVADIAVVVTKIEIPHWFVSILRDPQGYMDACHVSCHNDIYSDTPEC